MIISLVNASKVINGNIILDNINLELHGGTVYGFQGPNGSGKTMLMRLIAGLIRPTSGAVFIDGKHLGHSIDFPDSIGLLIENPAFLPNYTGFKNLELLAQLKNRISTEDIRNAIRDVGLNPDDRRKYRKYSLGMKQRLGVAAAIMERPDIVLLDEPTNALDERGVEEICRLICRERDRGALVIVACHDASILDVVADKIVTITEGKAMLKG